MDKLVKMCKEYEQKLKLLSSITQIEEIDIMKKAYSYAERLGDSTDDILNTIQYLLGKGKSWQEVCNDLDNNIFPNTTIDNLIYAPQPMELSKVKIPQEGIFLTDKDLNPICPVIEIKLGDKVIRKDGLVGKVVEIVDNSNGVTIEWDNGLIDLDLPPQSELYLIGKTVLGNKIDEEELQRQLDEQWDKCKVEQAKYDQLRKQLWYLKNRMVEDWYEKKQQADKEKAERKAKKGE